MTPSVRRWIRLPHHIPLLRGRKILLITHVAETVSAQRDYELTGFGKRLHANGRPGWVTHSTPLLLSELDERAVRMLAGPERLRSVLEVEP